VLKHTDIPTRAWFNGTAKRQLNQFNGRNIIEGAALCSVVPKATPAVRNCAARIGAPASGTARNNRRTGPQAGVPILELNAKTVRGVGINYPRPQTIGPDRLANAVAARKRFGAPVVVVDFGTAVTFDVVDARGNYVGGIIAPGLAAMTDYLHEKTALLPRVRIRETRQVVGKSTEHAMLVGAVHGYRGLVRELIGALKKELRAKNLRVVATGGYASLIARGIPEISAVVRELTLEGLRLTWMDLKQSD